MPFERFMELALYGPDGYFTSGPLRSEKAGDFLTSPEISPMFGSTLAVFVKQEMGRIGEPFQLIEVAAGSGTLLGPLLATFPVSARAVEVSAAARRALAATLPEQHIVGDFAELPEPMRGVILANEFVDNLPMAIAQLTPGGWRERWVGLDGDDLTFVDHPVRPEVKAWLLEYAGPVEPGGWVEVQLEAAAWLKTALERLTAGCVVLIDYGDLAENLSPRRRDGTLRTYRSHHLGPHPLDEPGATDITADVNFSALVATARSVGASVELHRQDDFLASLGLRQHLGDLRRKELELARRGHSDERLLVRNLVHEAQTLLHPRGLGDFRVLIARK
ncbi:MAG TPA: SAM-dependent methyltransferase [Acidimicrobiia bacterium]|nr:SAM-dependent methyltransferase [Acidimicrobiia bacterium]